MSNELPAPDEERVEIVINERVYHKGDEVGKIRRHIHTQHWIGQKISVPSPSGLELVNIWIHYCPGCKLTWYDELPNTPIQFQAKQLILKP